MRLQRKEEFPGMPLLGCRQAALGYEGKRMIENLSFSVSAGDYLCIVGENGAGKSTLMKTILGFIPLIAGQIVWEDDLKKNQIGYLPQQTNVQKDFPASVLEVVLSGCLGQCGLRPFYRKEEKQCAKNHMERLGIASLSAQCYRELSGGQHQRVLLARALCATQTMLLLDEPVAGLDPKATQDMYQTISDLHQKQGITVMMISHDITAALRYATHILHIGTEPLFFGSKEAYLQSEAGRIFYPAEGGDAVWGH